MSRRKRQTKAARDARKKAKIEKHESMCTGINGNLVSTYELYGVSIPYRNKLGQAGVISTEDDKMILRATDCMKNSHTSNSQCPSCKNLGDLLRKRESRKTNKLGVKELPLYWQEKIKKYKEEKNEAINQLRTRTLEERKFKNLQEWINKYPAIIKFLDFLKKVTQQHKNFFESFSWKLIISSIHCLAVNNPRAAIVSKFYSEIFHWSFKLWFE